MSRRLSSSTARTGFSIVELLVVIAIVGLLAAVTMPAITSTLRAMNLSDTTNRVVSELNLARQTAVARQVPVEVRFYLLPEESDAATAAPSAYRGMQTFLCLDTGLKPLNRPRYFTAPVRISTNTKQSSIFDPALTTEMAASGEISTYRNNYRYRSFYFRPSGELSIQGTNVFLTLLLGKSDNLSEAGNFATIQIDGITGRAWTYTP
jgi:uncharacterized protein (TIGR02596 family)